MSYISKYDTKFLTFMNRKYSAYRVAFDFFDDYAMWLYYDLCNSNKIQYYKTLEKDLWDYIEFQSGKEREVRGKLNEKWEHE